MSVTSVRVLLGLLCLVLIACGKGTSSEDQSDLPVSVETNDSTASETGEETNDSAQVSPDTIATTSPRIPLATLNLPIEGSSIGNYRLVKAYPELNFLEALLVAAVPGEKRLVVVEQAGRIKVFEDDPAATNSKVILDFSEKVVFSGEQGLLGLAFDPDFANNRFVYINYTRENPDQTIVSRLEWNTDEDTLDESTEQVILSVDQPYHSHNAGMIAFGPDNYLYIALGDGGDGGDPHNYAQDTSSLLGSLLRIDVHPAGFSGGYVIPPDNPFVDNPWARAEIFAYGFRNPFRFSFDRANGDIWLGDVGQEHREEINRVVAGGNYGWRVFEGTKPNEGSLNDLPDSAFTTPVHEYDHASGLSVIGGYVYRGERVSSLQGRYIYADFYSGVVTALDWDGSRVTSQTALATVDGPTSFGETHDGDVLVVSRYHGIYRFEEAQDTNVFPEKLSETGLFHDLESLSPVSGLIEYQTAHPFWSDGANKRRWIGVPENDQIAFSNDDWWFALGSVSVKHFEMEMTAGLPQSSRRLETRVLYNTIQGWQGFSYRWNEQQNEALLVLDRQMESLEIKQPDGSVQQQEYEYPGNRDCTVCHNNSSAFLLGLETRQMNIAHQYDDGLQNQIYALNQQALFDQDVDASGLPSPLPGLTDEEASLDSRARAYLDVNCSHCHQPGAPAATQLDLRFGTPAESMGTINTYPQKGTFGLSDAKVIAPGQKNNSILWLRMNRLESGRMPPIATHRIDQTGVKLIGDWIDNL